MQLETGQSAGFDHTFQASDVDRFAQMSAGEHRLYAGPASTLINHPEKNALPAMLLFSLVSRLLNTQLPGPGTVHLEGQLDFPTPAYAGEPLRIRSEVAMLHKGGLAHMTTRIMGADGNPCCQARSLVRLPGEPLAPFESMQPSLTEEYFSTQGDSSQMGQLSLGQSDSVQKSFTLEEVAAYMLLTGDANPLFKRVSARQAGYREALVPPALLGEVFCSLIAAKLQGLQAGVLKQTLSFPQPAHINEALTAQVEILQLRPEQDQVIYKTTCTNIEEKIVCSGEALLQLWSPKA